RDQVIGRRVTEILPGIESAPQKWIQVYGDIALNGGTLRKEDYSRELNRWYTISAYSPQPGHFVAVFEDITERKQAEAAAREAQRAAAALLGNLPGMAYRCRNDRDWTMEYISDGCLELTGYPTTELIDSSVRSYNDLIHPDDREFVWQEVQDGVKKNRRYRMTYRIISRNREIKWVWEQGAALRDANGDVAALEGFIADITDRVRAEEALHHREERFRALIESSSDIIMLFDERGCVTYTSPSTARILGYSPGEIVRLAQIRPAGVERRVIRSVARLGQMRARFVLPPQAPLDQRQVVLCPPVRRKRLPRPLENRDRLLPERKHQIRRERRRLAQRSHALRRRALPQQVRLPVADFSLVRSGLQRLQRILLQTEIDVVGCDLQVTLMRHLVADHRPESRQ
ncbi:MAG: PAS domain S-box protein, partial [Bryobacteraceae bacterium]|nr:PAS domain S-box protein [Bryobacteraceae bacterium]